MRVALGLSYDGAAFQGWQTQPGGQTVQDHVESALASFLAHPVKTVCAGRTDTGVHALEQVIHVDTPAQRPAHAWVRGVNALLAPSVAVQWAMPVADSFHARFSAASRTYVYILRNHTVRSPLLAARAGRFFRPLDVECMRAAAAYLTGEHDFSSFRSSQCQARHPVRTLYALDIVSRPPFIVCTFNANAFLHHMVRNMMGALVDVGAGRRAPDWIPDLLARRDRRHASPTFAPDGLYLAAVDYPAIHAFPSVSVAVRLRTLLGIDLEAF